VAASQPQAQISAALASARQALTAEPEPADKATLRHAINLLQRVFDRNARESGTPEVAARPKTNETYSSIAAKHTSPPTNKGAH
jgi:hypothetical protein